MRDELYDRDFQAGREALLDGIDRLIAKFRQAFRAITASRPGHLGAVSKQDVSIAPDWAEKPGRHPLAGDTACAAAKLEKPAC